MNRLVSLSSLVAGVCAGVALFAAAPSAHAQSQAQIAAQLNEEGKELAINGKFSESSAKFREAVARVPEAKYFYNLCSSLLAEGKFDEALTACNAVGNNNPDPALITKVSTLTDKIRAEADKQNLQLHAAGGGGGGEVGTNPDNGTPPGPNGNPNSNPPPSGNPPPTGNYPPTGNPNPNPNYPPNGSYPPPNGQVSYRPAVGRPPEENLFVATTPDNHYTWTLGIDLFGGGGKIGTGYGNSDVGFRVKGDYLVSRRARVGLEAYVQYSTISGENGNGASLDLIDVGLAVYKNFCPGLFASRFCITPLVGAQVALFDPNGPDATGTSTFNYAAAGFRGEISADYAFGRRFEHVISLAVGVNAYTKVLSDPSGDGSSPTAMEVGLDTGGAFGYVGLGYTYRFNTPLGSRPIVILE